MTTLFKSPFSIWIRGAQSTVHEARMFTQSLVQTALFGLIIVMIGAGYAAYTAVDRQERYTLVRWTEAAFNVVVRNDPARPIRYRDENDRIWNIRSGAYYDAPMVRRAAEKVGWGALRGAGAGFGLMALIILGLLVFFYLAGRGQSGETFIRGARSGSARDLSRALRKEGPPGSVRIGKVRLPRTFETSHLLCLGASGSGKTQLISSLLDGVREKGGRAIVYDVAGVFVEAFYRPGRDTILNPLDARAPHWTLWRDARFQSDYDQIAASLFPEEGTRDTFWSHAPQVVFRAVARKLADEGRTTNKDLLDVLTRSTHEELGAYCKGTEAASILSEKGDRMTASVIATIAASLRGFAYLGDDGVPFSIRDWVEDDDGDGWLFITTRNDQIDALKPLITMWVDIATASLLSLRPDADRRIWLVFDELQTLNQLPSLLNVLAQSRKYGGCAALSSQNYARLKAVWGEQGAEAVTGACATWAVMRTDDVATAEWASKALGQTEQAEASEGLSIGRHEMHDGRTIQRQRVTRPIVLPSELRNLPELSFYLTVGRGFPVVPDRIEYRQFPEREPAFIRKPEPQMVARLPADATEAPSQSTGPRADKKRQGSDDAGPLFASARNSRAQRN